MRVAIVSYYAPPDPAVASHRVLRLTRSLIDAGHEVHWVTLDAAQLLRSDETLPVPSHRRRGPWPPASEGPLASRAPQRTRAA